MENRVVNPVVIYANYPEDVSKDIERINSQLKVNGLSLPPILVVNSRSNGSSKLAALVMNNTRNETARRNPQTKTASDDYEIMEC